MSRLLKKQRVIVYIDGYNLYHGLHAAFGSQYKWLDLQAFSESFLLPSMKLITVKYFTSITKSATGSRLRQEIYLKALKTHCDKLDIFYGNFLIKSRRCRACGDLHDVYEEKKTDVNIACEILHDTHEDRYDCCYVVSGDSDLVPPLKIVKGHYPDKRTIVAHPPKRKSTELCQIADGWFAINRKKFRSNLLPDKVISTISGSELVRPEDWQ